MKIRWHFYASAVLLVSTFLYLRTLEVTEDIPLRKALSTIPLTIDAWKGTEDSLEQKIIDILGVEDSIVRTYTRENVNPISLYVGYYQSQSQGDTIHSPKHCMPGSGWQPIREEVGSLDLVSGVKIPVNRYLLQKGMSQQLVLYWYQERGRIVTNEYMAKVYLVLDSMLRNRTDGALVRISSMVTTSVEETLRQQEEFIRLIFPYLKESLPD